MTEEVKYLRRRNEELSHNDEDCQANRARVLKLEGELNTLKTQTSNLHEQRIILKQSQNLPAQPPGELPDLNPAAVDIRQPALNGTTSAFGFSL